MLVGSTLQGQWWEPGCRPSSRLLSFCSWGSWGRGGSKSSLWISKWFIWERAAVSSHPIVKAHIQVQQTASDITYASELLHFRVLLKFCTFTVHTWYSASGKKKLIWSYLLETKNGTDTPFNQKKQKQKQTETIRNRVIHYLDNLTKLCDKLVLVFLDTGINPGGPQSGSLEEGQTDVFLHTLSQLQPPEGLFPRCSGKVLQLSFSLCKTP